MALFCLLRPLHLISAHKDQEIGDIKKAIETEELRHVFGNYAPSVSVPVPGGHSVPALERSSDANTDNSGRCDTIDMDAFKVGRDH